MDYLKVENVSADLESAMDLMQLLSEETEDIHEALIAVQKAKTPAERSGAVSLLLVQLENRFNIIDTLQSSVSRNLDIDRDALDKLIDKEIEDDKQATKKGDAKNARA